MGFWSSWQASRVRAEIDPAERSAGGPVPSCFSRGRRGVHDPAPASASLYGFAADCPARDREPLFTLAWLGATDRSPGYRGGAGRVFPSFARGPLSSGGADADSHLPAKAPPSMGAPVSGSTEPSWRGRRWSSGRSSLTAKPSNAPIHHPAQAPPSLGGRCSAPENMLEGEGSTVLRRTVCGRRPWSEALAGGGPSIPLPFHTQGC